MDAPRPSTAELLEATRRTREAARRARAEAERVIAEAERARAEATRAVLSWAWAHLLQAGRDRPRSGDGD